MHPSPDEESTNNATLDQANKDALEEVKNGDLPAKQVDWSTFSMTEIYKQESETEVNTKKPAQDAYDKMFGYKETFLPEKRNLYEALASEDGFHRFGQRKHFIDPFAEET